MSQVLADFRQGRFNTLVATCIGEEGLDIPQVLPSTCSSPCSDAGDVAMQDASWRRAAAGVGHRRVGSRSNATPTVPG